MLGKVSFSAIGQIVRRLRRFNAEAQRFAEIRREFFFSAFLRVPLRLCVKSCAQIGNPRAELLSGAGFFGFRLSALGFPSGFGSRISGSAGLRGNASATPRCPGDVSWPFVGLVELVILFPHANQVADRVCPGLKPTSARAQKLTRQFPASEQRLEGDESLAPLGPLQFCAGMDVKFTRNVRRDAYLITLGHGRCHRQNLPRHRSCNKPAPRRRTIRR